MTSLGLKAHAKRWRDESIEVEGDYAAIIAKAIQAAESKATMLPDVLRDVRDRQSQEIARIFDTSPFRPNPNLSTLILELESSVGQAQAEYQHTMEVAKELFGATVARFSVAQITFWRVGLGLVSPTDSTTCPFCEQPTLTPELLGERRARLDNNQQFEDLRLRFSEACDQFLAVLAKISETSQLLQVRRLDATDKATLSKAFEHGTDHLNEFDQQNRKVTDVLQSLQNRLAGTKRVFEEAKETITDR